ncbi:hypothetical protein EIN_102380, partial [Entamoeba invadens IP1]
MTRLEPFYLRNVVLYLPTLKDLLNFVCINKNAHEVAQSLYINPYSLPVNVLIQKIVKLFPKLETLYIPYTIYENLSFLESLGTFLIELRQTCVVNMIRHSANIIEALSTEWFPKRVRSLHVFNEEVNVLADNISKYTLLTDLVFITNTLSKDNFIKIISHKTLRNVTFNAEASDTDFITRVDFSKMPKTNFNIQIFATNNQDLSDRSVENFSKISPNVKLYIGYLSDIMFDTKYKTKNIKYLPFFSEKSLNRTSLRVLNKNLGEPNLFEFIQKALPTEFQVVRDFTIDDKFTSVIKVDFTKIQEEFFFVGVILRSVQFSEIILPKTVRYILIRSVKGSINTNACRIENIDISDYQNDTFKFECEKLRYFLTDESPVCLLYKGKKVFDTFFIKVGENLPYDIIVKRNSKVVFLRGEEKIGEILFNGWLRLFDTKIVFENVIESFDISNIRTDEIKIFEIQKQISSPFSFVFGE